MTLPQSLQPIAMIISAFSVLSFFAYFIDKKFAQANEVQRQKWRVHPHSQSRRLSQEDLKREYVRLFPEQSRVPEMILHSIDLLGGWPGGWLARNMFSHKTSKRSFVWRFWYNAVLSMTILGSVAAVCDGHVDAWEWVRILSQQGC